jgi:hypothetical protein
VFVDLDFAKLFHTYFIFFRISFLKNRFKLLKQRKKCRLRKTPCDHVSYFFFRTFRNLVFAYRDLRKKRKVINLNKNKLEYLLILNK